MSYLLNNIGGIKQERAALDEALQLFSVVLPSKAKQQAIDLRVEQARGGCVGSVARGGLVGLG